MNKKYIVRLSDEERRQLTELTRKGKAAAYKIRHANILLKTDADGPSWTDDRIAESFSVSVNTVLGVRQRLVEQGLEAALNRKKTGSSLPSSPLGWRGRGTADRAQVQCATHRTCPLDAQALGRPGGGLGDCRGDQPRDGPTGPKKNALKPHLRKMWVIPPEQSGAFVAHMEDVLDIYHRPYDPQVPMVCMDEQPVQLIKEVRQPLPAEEGQPERYDYEYERNGTANIFMFTEPLSGVRMVSVREHKTAIDWASEVQQLLDTHYPEADRIRLVCDNLNTHGIGALYEAFPPEQARGLASRLEIHYTPKHGSWLNIAEIELSALTLQCLDRRIPDLETLIEETTQWEKRRNASQKGVDWQFSTHDASIKLKRLYPQIQS